MLNGYSTGEGLIIAGDILWTDYEITTVAKTLSGSSQREASIVGRYTNQNNFYWLGLGCWNHFASIGKRSSGISKEVTFTGSSTNVVFDKKYTLKAIFKGNKIQFYVDEILTLEYEDPDPILSGSIGLRLWNSRSQFDYIDVKEIVIPPTGVNSIFEGEVSEQSSPGQTVTITITQPDNSELKLTAQTQADGKYSINKEFTVEGIYKAKATIEADDKYKPAESSEETFTIELLQPRNLTLTITLNPIS